MCKKTDCKCSFASGEAMEHNEATATAYTSADLCNQCRMIDLDGLLAGEIPNYKLPWLRSKKESACPLCCFFAKIGFSKDLLTGPGTEIEFRLEPTTAYYAFWPLFSDIAGLGVPGGGSPVVGLTTKGFDFKFPEFGILPVFDILSGEKPPPLTVRHLQPNSIDFTVLRDWLAYCKTHHVGTCNFFPGYPQQVPGLKLIDCETKCIITAPEGCEFVALSYVWGASHKKEKDGPSGSGSLPDDIPRTIVDAMQVVRQLHLRYLWVDKYCIDQNEVAELQQQIGIMDMIYNLATVTIVAACGEDASFGIPGVGLTERVEQPSINLDRRTWVCCHGDPKTQIQNTTWFTRAWTYQEGLFSKRRLIFTKAQVYFECNKRHFQETLAYNLHHLDEQRQYLPGGLFDGGFSSEYTGGLDIHIQAYSKRPLTYQEDIINAFAGVFRAFSSMRSPIRHFYGIPMDWYRPVNSPWPSNWSRLSSPSDEFPDGVDSTFARALCWDLHIPSSRREGFPSWSWAGWIGELSHYLPWGHVEDFGDSEVKIWLRKEDNTYNRLNKSVRARLSHQDSLTISYTPILRIEAWTVNVEFEYFAAGIECVNTHGEEDNPNLKYLASAKIATTREFPRSYGRCYWPIVLSFQVTVGDELHRELCEQRFDCILLSKQAQFGLVVRKNNDFTEKIGHIDSQKSGLQLKGPPELSTYNLFDCLPCKRQTILLG